MPLGIKNYIQHVLANGKEVINPPIPGGRRGTKWGRCVDQTFTKVIAGKISLNYYNAVHKDVKRALDALSVEQIRPLESQVRVHAPTIGVVTPIDAIGLDAAGNRVAIELKTTSAPMNLHVENTKRIQAGGVLANGLHNTEENWFNLQAAFGVYFGENIKRAIVIIVCSDGVVKRWVKNIRREHYLPTPPTFSLVKIVPPLVWNVPHQHSKRFVRFGKELKKDGNVCIFERGVLGFVSSAKSARKKKLGQRECIRQAAIRAKKPGFEVILTQGKVTIKQVCGS